MAVCAAHGIDYLLSWNYAHLVNPVAQRQLESICANLSMPATPSFAGINSQSDSWTINQEATKMKDVIVDEVRRVRQELIMKHGGLIAWMEHLQEKDRERARAEKKRNTKKIGRPANKRKKDA
jgi:hypothetical protein